MTIEHIRGGSPYRDDHHNRVADQVNRNSRPGTTDRAQYGTGGVTYTGSAETHLVLFELTAALTYPGDTDQCPYAAAKRVWFDASEGTYGNADKSPQETVYHPLAARDAAGKYVGQPKMRAGDWTVARFNRQSSRWEIVIDQSVISGQASAAVLGLAPGPYWGKLDETLEAGGSATVSIWAHPTGNLVDTGVDLTAHDWLLGTGQALESGTKVKVEWFPSCLRWFVTNAEC